MKKYFCMEKGFLPRETECNEIQVNISEVAGTEMQFIWFPERSQNYKMKSHWRLEMTNVQPKKQQGPIAPLASFMMAVCGRSPWEQTPCDGRWEWKPAGNGAPAGGVGCVALPRLVAGAARPQTGATARTAEAPGRAHSVHPARVPSGRSSFTLSSVSCVMPSLKEWVGGQNTASRRELRPHARLASVATCINALYETGTTARTAQQNVFWMRKCASSVIRRSAPKTGRHRAGRTPYTPCRLS